AAVVAFLDRVLRIAKVIRVELQQGVVVVVGDRKHRLEHRLQSDLLATVGLDVLLQERLVRPLLDLDQIRDLDDRRNLSEVLAAAPPAAAPATPGMAATAIGAAADTPHCSCSSLLSCDASSTVNLPSSSAIWSMLAIASPLYLPSEGLRRAPALDGRATHAPAEFCLATTVETPPSCGRGLFRVLAALRQHVYELALRRLQKA